MPPNTQRNDFSGKLCFLYLLISASISVILFCFFASHVQTLRKIEKIEKHLEFVLSVAVKLNSLKEESHADDLPKSFAENTEYLKMTIEDIIIRNSEKLLYGLIDVKQMIKEKYLYKATDINMPPPIDNKISMRPDFALESLGGEVISIENTKIYYNSWLNFGSSVNNHRLLLNPSNQPGECFAFIGTKANITIKLMGSVFIDSISVDHITVDMSPSGNINTAPNEFQVYGYINFENKHEHPHYFGKFNYDIENDEQSSQIFLFQKLENLPSFRYVHFRFLSNHGNAEHTCIYRIRVHGTLDATKEMTEHQIN